MYLSSLLSPLSAPATTLLLPHAACLASCESLKPNPLSSLSHSLMQIPYYSHANDAMHAACTLD